MESKKCLKSIVCGYNVTKFNIFGAKCQDPIVGEWKNEFPPLFFKLIVDHNLKNSHCKPQRIKYMKFYHSILFTMV